MTAIQWYTLSDKEFTIQKEMDTYISTHKEILWKGQEKDILFFTKQAQQRVENNRKSKSITLRITEPDLISIKAKAIKLGIPYQTLIGSWLHQHAIN